MGTVNFGQLKILGTEGLLIFKKGCQFKSSLRVPSREEVKNWVKIVDFDYVKTVNMGGGRFKTQKIPQCLNVTRSLLLIMSVTEKNFVK